MRWFRQNVDVTALARDHGVSRATGYRYLNKIIDVLAGQAPDLHEALERAKAEGLAYVILDGKVFSADRCDEKTMSVKENQIDLWSPAKPASTAATCKRSPGRMSSRCEWPLSSPAPCMT